MKTMTCKQLSGACDKEFHANTFDEMEELSKRHAMEMYRKGDEEHIKIMKEMMELMKDHKAMKKCMDGMRKVFDTLPEDKKLVR